MTLVPTVPTVKATLRIDVPFKLTKDPDKSRSDDSINITKAQIQGNIGRRDSSPRDDGLLFGEGKIIISLVLWRVSEDTRQQAGRSHIPHTLSCTSKSERSGGTDHGAMLAHQHRMPSGVDTKVARQYIGWLVMNSTCQHCWSPS